jgi:alcohol dehydrogenase (cytochrome c)
MLAVLTAGAQSSPSSGPRSSNDRVFTAAQAERGKVLFADVCSACHPDPLWRPTWEGKPLGDLYTKISKFMPDDNPGTLTPAEALSAIAYILQANGAPAGELPLTENLTVLNRIRIDPAPPQTP